MTTNTTGSLENGHRLYRIPLLTPDVAGAAHLSDKSNIDGYSCPPESLALI
jgi:hypothetical protein